MVSGCRRDQSGRHAGSEDEINDHSSDNPAECRVWHKENEKTSSVIPDISLWDLHADSEDLDIKDDSRELLADIVLPSPFDRRRSTEAKRPEEDTHQRCEEGSLKCSLSRMSSENSAWRIRNDDRIK